MTIEANWSDRPEDELIDETTAATPRSRCCCARATWSTSTAGARCAASRSSPARIRRVLAAKLDAITARVAEPDMNMMTATECLLEMCDEHLELEDYQSGVPRWCTGCGDNAILAAVQRLCRDEGLRPEKTVFVSGIGCSSRFPHYMKTYGFHGIHGRALPVAEGVKMSRPDLDVFVNTGDGDCCSIGAAHWIHAHPLQHEPDGVPARQPDLRADQEAGVADLADRHQEQHDAARQLPRGAESADGDARRAERLVRRAGGRLDSRAALRHRQGRVPPPGAVVRAHRPALPGMAADAARPVAARPEPGAGAAPRATACSSAPASAAIYKNQLRARSARTSTARARSPASTTPIPVGILYRNPEVPCYEELSAAPCCARRQLIRSGLKAEFDKFTVWPKAAEAGDDQTPRAPGSMT